MDLNELKKLELQLLGAAEEERAIEEAAADLQTFQVLVFELGNERYGLRITDIIEIVRPGRIFPVPSTPAYITGVINLRGNIVCVVDPMKKMALGAVTHGEGARAIVVKYEKAPVGLLVDRIIDVVDIHGNDVHPLPPDHVSGCMEGDVRIQGDAFRLLRAAEVLKRD